MSVFSVHLVDFILSHGLSTTTQVALAQKGVCVFFFGGVILSGEKHGARATLTFVNFPAS